MGRLRGIGGLEFAPQEWLDSQINSVGVEKDEFRRVEALGIRRRKRLVACTHKSRLRAAAATPSRIWPAIFKPREDVGRGWHHFSAQNCKLVAKDASRNEGARA